MTFLGLDKLYRQLIVYHDPGYTGDRMVSKNSKIAFPNFTIRHDFLITRQN
jgi:hypothetical protein